MMIISHRYGRKHLIRFSENRRKKKELLFPSLMFSWSGMSRATELVNWVLCYIYLYNISVFLQNPHHSLAHEWRMRHQRELGFSVKGDLFMSMISFSIQKKKESSEKKKRSRNWKQPCWRLAIDSKYIYVCFCLCFCKVKMTQQGSCFF